MAGLELDTPAEVMNTVSAPAAIGTAASSKRRGVEGQERKELASYSCPSLGSLPEREHDKKSYSYSEKQIALTKGVNSTTY